jgi:hypothetical protein
MISGAQIRAALGLVGRDEHWLAEKIGVHPVTIRRAQRVDGTPRMLSDKLAKIQKALEDEGVLFLEADDTRTGGEGVRRRPRPPRPF